MEVERERRGSTSHVMFLFRSSPVGCSVNGGIICIYIVLGAVVYYWRIISFLTHNNYISSLSDTDKLVPFILYSGPSYFFVSTVSLYRFEPSVTTFSAAQLVLVCPHNSEIAANLDDLVETARLVMDCSSFIVVTLPMRNCMKRHGSVPIPYILNLTVCQVVHPQSYLELSPS